MSRMMRSPEAPAVIELPAPAETPGISVFSALCLRRTTRAISEKPLPPQLLSNVLWAAWGVNRVNGPFGLPGRTAASAANSQEIDVYAALKSGLYLYDAPKHRLEHAAAGDLRPLALSPGRPGLGAKAPLQLIFVADLRRLSEMAGFQEPGLEDPEVQKSYYYADTGLIAGNVYLYAASQGLAAWFHNCDAAGLARRLGLGPEQRVLFAQSVGWPAP